ncbi:hypothetical protein A3J36_01015 [Candidatus Uhrbacteria bacterium RIFCSPLOWO2_02_FULL_54_37]|uniref:Uncharacterized protein n=1 Tax=Candidatus Uhrbacteria bacterium RIFCSPLOWO2_02_FULL_54_37 TaxID=1802412 RepID=A0A1F7VJ53_9BACT|nr:MAG: hypothetical protein A3J36_01015 [Candidatus Uhrbacteria bacterium RIFCSPLOWO2_02_FULL_54_37]
MVERLVLVDGKVRSRLSKKVREQELGVEPGRRNACRIKFNFCLEKSIADGHVAMKCKNQISNVREAAGIHGLARGGMSPREAGKRSL